LPASMFTPARAYASFTPHGFTVRAQAARSPRANSQEFAMSRPPGPDGYIER
jgi:hypothetical protein